MVSIKLK